MTFAECFLFAAGVALLLRLLRPLRVRLESYIYRFLIPKRPHPIHHIIDITKSHKKED
jgi:hypothetical protein